MNKQERMVRDKKLVELYESGLSQPEAGKQVGLKKSMAGRVLRRMGVKARKAGSPKGHRHEIYSRLDEVKALYESGLTCDEVGKKLGASRFSVRECLKQLGIQARGADGLTNLDKPKTDWEGIKRCYLEGMKYKDICKKLKIDRSRIHYSLCRLGVERRYPKMTTQSPNERDTKVLLALTIEGVNATARRFGMTKQRVSQIKYRWSKWLAENPKIVH